MAEMGRYRCLNSKCSMGEFKSLVPACPGCKLDARVSPGGGYIVRIETIHFDPPHPVIGDKGTGHLACDPTKTVPGRLATGDHSTVNCETCRESEAFKDSCRGPIGKGPDDAAVEVDPTTGSLKFTPAG